jgi:hypothetical protein
MAGRLIHVRRTVRNTIQGISSSATEGRDTYGGAWPAGGEYGSQAGIHCSCSWTSSSKGPAAAITSGGWYDWARPQAPCLILVSLVAGGVNAIPGERDPVSTAFD